LGRRIEILTEDSQLRGRVAFGSALTTKIVMLTAAGSALYYIVALVKGRNTLVPAHHLAILLFLEAMLYDPFRYA